MKVTIFGAATPTGRALVEEALDAGHAVTVLAREPGTFPVEHDRLTVVEGDVFDVPSVEDVTHGADVVITAFDAPVDRLPGADNADAMSNVLAALEKYRTDRLFVVTAATVEPDRSPGLRERLEGLLSGDEDESDLEEQEQRVVESDTDWTIVRPVRLTDGPRTGDYRVGESLDDGEATLSRADLAAFIVDQFDADTFHRRTVTVAGSGE